MRMRENERMSPIFEEIFSCNSKIRNQVRKQTEREGGVHKAIKATTYVCTCFEALCTITSMEEKCLVALNEADLIAETLDLLQDAHIESASTEIRVAFGFARHIGSPRRA